jgi:Na+/H+ antiporter NhaD/arsenite permease-like protein
MSAQAFSVPLLALLPFGLMLFAIAVFPLVRDRWWRRNRNKLAVALVLGLPIAVFLLSSGMQDKLVGTLFFDYLPFIILLGSLFTITGGISLTGDIEARPIINTAFLGIGAVLASVMGTTGAAMLLVRPVIKTNQERSFKVHTVLFFIAIVANCGGLLTPLGDPPLFMMYLRGTPFTWFSRLLPEWLFTNGLLLGIYFLVDTHYFKKESLGARLRDQTYVRAIRLRGKLNLVWLAGVVLAIAFMNEQFIHAMRVHEYLKFAREGVVAGMAGLSLVLTPRLDRVANNFTWGPIQEVACLFLGIFVTMVPCILYLEHNAQHLGVNLARHFYYASGGLSSVLDNTPTAVTFYSLALGLGKQTSNMVAGIPYELMRAICLGSVFFGSMTYIGNGPNFMVRAIAEDNNIKMPHFFSYIFRFSLIVLLPVFVLVQLLMV